MNRVATLAAGIVVSALAVTYVTESISTAKQFDGREIFRFDTFRDEQLWTDTLRMHEALSTVTPATALAVGLKVDAEALSPPVLKALVSGQLDVNDPRVTLRLLEMNAVVGVMGKVRGDKLMSVGITCALCHSTVDDSLADGIGKRLDGWANGDLDVGRIVALSPVLSGALKAELRTWGPGKYDPRHHIFDGTNLVILNSPSFPVVIPPAYGLRGVGFETYTGDGPISYWNSYVGVTQMGGHGSFSDPRIGVTVIQKPDVVTPKLPELLAYQLSLTAPRPPAGSVNAAAAARGQAVFNGVAGCGNCHIAPTYTDVLREPTPFLHLPSAVGTETLYATRSATKMYRTTPLRGLWQHPPYFHDGSAATLLDVVNHYSTVFGFVLSTEQRNDLVEFLKSL
jgi:hypothetical protein